MFTEFVLEVFSEVQFFRNHCIMLHFFLYIYTFYYRSYYYYYSFIVVSFTFDSNDHPSSASRESVIIFVRYASFSFRCSVTDKIKQKNEKKGEKPLCRNIRTQFSVFPIFSQL